MATGHVIQVAECGGPEVLKWIFVNLREPGPGEVLVRNRAIGLNFLDVQLRAGVYQTATPFIPGGEGIGTVEALGPDVGEFAVGDRVGYIGYHGAYCELTVRPTERLIRLPESLGDRDAASILFKGMTAECFVRRVHRVAPGETILVHAAAGGLGSIITQWATGIGAEVVGTVGSRDKVEIARAAGCAHVIINDEEDFVEGVRAITHGRGVDVVYDGVGKATFAGSLDCLAPFGLMAIFGAASGKVPPFDIHSLATKRSIFLTWPGLFQYTATTEQLRESAASLFDAIEQRLVHPQANQVYALRDATQAHADLAARKLTGSTIFIP